MLKFKIFIFLLLIGSDVIAQSPQAAPESVVTNGEVRFTVLTPQLIRMEWSADGRFEDLASLTFINRHLSTPTYTVRNSRSQIEIRTEKLTLRYRKGGKFSPENLSVRFRVANVEQTWRPGDNDSANLKGTTRTLDRANGYKLAEPLENGILSRDGWALVDDSQRHLLRPDSSAWGEWVTPREKGDRQDWYLFAYGHDYTRALADYSRIAGRSPLPPKYAFGYWWSRYWQYSDNEFHHLIGQIRKHSIPIDVLIVDMDWHETWGMNHDKNTPKDEYGQRVGWTGYTWQKELFPSPKNFLQWTENEQLQVALNLHPASGIQPYEDIYDKFTKSYGWDKPQKSVPFHIDEQRWADTYFKEVLAPMEQAGVDFWWLDWQQWRESKFTPGLSNTFWLNHTFYHHAAQSRPELRPMIYHRWGGLGSHRYQVAFSGDTHGSWATLAFLPYFTATASNVNYGYWGHDIGGHMQPQKSTDPELYTRWLQYGVFTPIFRTHSSKTPRIERRIWMFPNHQEMMHETFRLRYRLAPYIYNAARINYDTGVAICRPMYYTCPEEDEAYHVPEQFMFGEELLATVIATPTDSITGVAARRIWFPKGDWFDCATGEMIQGGGFHTQNYTLAENPYYARSGAIIPMNPDNVMSLQRPCDTLVLTFIPGQTGELNYYEDEGKSQQYKTQYATTRITKQQQGSTTHITIAARQGNYDGASAERSYELRLPATFPPQVVRVNGREIPYARFPKAGEWKYDGYKLSPIIYIPPMPCNAPIEIEIVINDQHLGCLSELYGKQKWFERCVSLTEEFKFACGEFDTWMMLPIEYLRVSQTPNKITENPARIVEYLAEFAAQIEPMHQRIASFDRLNDKFKERIKVQLQ